MKLNEFFDRRYLKQDIIAGLTLAVESIPDGMAIGALGAVSPLNGVYAYMVGGLSGAFFTSSISMGIQATSAMAVIVATVPEVAVGQPNAKDALLLLAVLTGVFMVLFGLLKWGNALRFIPNSVMQGFTHAIGFIIVLGQLIGLTGYDAQGPNKPMQFIDLLRHLDQVDIPSLVTGLVAIFLVVILKKPLKNFSILASMFLASLVPLFLGWDSVAVVQDIAPIPNKLPLPFIPDLSTLPALVMPALALAIVGLVQGAAVTSQFPNPDGSKPDPNGDFTGQGIANIITGFFQGLPVGGSFSATAILVGAGARTRLANIVSGLGIAGILLLVSGVIGKLAMPALAGFLLVLGIGVVDPSGLAATWKIGGISRYGMIFLILVGLFVSLQATVFVGVLLAFILYVSRQSNSVAVKQCEYEDGHLVAEYAVKPELESNSIVILRHYGSLFFASAQNYEDQLPKPGEDTEKSVVILNLRGQENLDSSVLAMFTDYHHILQKHNCRLILAGVEDPARQMLERTGEQSIIGSENIYSVSEHLQESVLKARDAAKEWINS